MGLPPHLPVLAGPAIEWLRVRPDGVYVDCTVGAAGHALPIAVRLTTGQLITLDRDPHAVALARDRLAEFACATVHHRNFAQLALLLHDLGVAHADGILYDLGLSSMQLEDRARGFAFQLEGPLDMRMDTTQPLTAADYLARVSEQELARALKLYGDVRPPRRIAAAVVQRRSEGRLQSTTDLREAVRNALGLVRGLPEEVRTVFQAIRIAVNDELNALTSSLQQAINLLTPGGRLVVISFHSGEDRIVKNMFRQASRKRYELYPNGRVREEVPPSLRTLTRKPVRPDEAECRANPRAQSARLRAAERLPIGAQPL